MHRHAARARSADGVHFTTRSLSSSSLPTFCNARTIGVNKCDEHVESQRRRFAVRFTTRPTLLVTGGAGGWRHVSRGSERRGERPRPCAMLARRGQRARPGRRGPVVLPDDRRVSHIFRLMASRWQPYPISPEGGIHRVCSRRVDTTWDTVAREVHVCGHVEESWLTWLGSSGLRLAGRMSGLPPDAPAPLTAKGGFGWRDGRLCHGARQWRRSAGAAAAGGGSGKATSGGRRPRRKRSAG